MVQSEAFKKKIVKVATNKRARFEYEIKETIEAGIELIGIEVKSLRVSKVVLEDAYAEIIDGQLWLKALHVTPYDRAGYEKADPGRKRKLLVHKAEILKFMKKVEQKGYTIVPLEIYFKGPWAKVLIGLGLGKKLHDKRQDLKKKSDNREAQRAMKSKNRFS